MTMHNPYYPQMQPYAFYYPPTTGYGAPPSEAPIADVSQGFPPKTRLPLQPSSAPATQPTHSTPMPESAEVTAQGMSASTTASTKKRLQFVHPNTNAPIDDIHSPLNFRQADSANPPLEKSETHHSSSRASSRPSSPRPAKSDIEKTVSEVIAETRSERSSSKKVTSRVQKTEIKSGEPAIAKKAATRVPLQASEQRKIIDPSNGTHTVGFKSSVSKYQEPIVVSKVKESPSNRESVLRTCESVERHVEEDKLELTRKEVKPQKDEMEEVKTEAVKPEAVKTEGVKTEGAKGGLILNPAARKSAKEVTAEVLKGTRLVAGLPKPAEKVVVEQPKSHPVMIGTSTPPPGSEQPEEKSDKSEEETMEVTKPVVKVEEKKELAAIEIKVDTTAVPKPETPSKNVYSPVVMQELKEKNKEPLPDMGAGPWLEGSEVDSPMKEPLPRRGSGGKLGSRSNSYQGLSRRSSTNSNRASRQSRSDPEEVFHVSSKKRIYSVDYMQSLKSQFMDKPQFQESLLCMKDFDGPLVRRSPSDKWPKQSRSGFDDRGKPSLSRSGSGRDWQKEARGSGVVVSRRMSRNYSGAKGADDSKWGKTDINLLSPFAPTSSGIGLHHSENKYIVGEMQTDDPEEEKRQKTFKGLLNKLTPSNFVRMYEKFKEVEIADAKTLKGLIDQIFDKALTETTFCPLYSDLCKLLTSEMPEFDEEGDKRKLTFRRLLLNKCQNEFEKGDAAVRAAEEAEAADASAMSAEERQSRLRAAKKERIRSLGNMQFIGFLFKKGMLTERIIHNCIVDLLREEENPKPEDIECLCQLLTTVGSLLPQGEVLDAYFCRIGRLSKSLKLETRHKFMLLDLIELKDRRWVERREKEGPKKIEEIHRDAQMEQMAQNARSRGGGYGGSNYSGRSGRSGWSRTSSVNTRPMTTFSSHEEVKPLTRNMSLGRTSSSDISLRPDTAKSSKAPVSVPRTRSRSPPQAPPTQQAPIEESAAEEAQGPALEGESLQRRVNSLLAEYYQVKDLDEALRCIEELIAENAAKPEILKNILLSALNIRGVDVNDRLKPISPLLKELLQREIFAKKDTKKGLQNTMAALPDVVDEFPIAPVLIARMLGTLVSEEVIPLKQILDSNGIILGAGREDQSEDDTPLVDGGQASKILMEFLKQMKSEEQEKHSVRDAVSNEGVDLLLFYPSYLRDDTDVSDILQYLD